MAKKKFIFVSDEEAAEIIEEAMDKCGFDESNTVGELLGALKDEEEG